MNESRSRALAVPVLALCAAAAYSNTLRVPFVFDDLGAVVRNATLRSLRTAFAPPAGGFTVTARPLLNLSFAANYLAGGLHPAGYHLANLAVHVAATLVLFGLVRRTVGSVPTAFAAALLWSLHPLQTESVTYVSQRAESLMGFFLLLTVYCFARAEKPSFAPHGGAATADQEAGERPRKGWLMASLVACLFGMATKEVMAAAPLLVLFYDRTFVSGSFRAALRGKAAYYAALAATWFVVATEVVAGRGRGGTVGLGLGMSWAGYVFGQCSGLVHYLRLAIWPAPLVFDYGLAPPFQPPLLALVAAAFALALAGATAWALVRRPALGYLGVWFFAILAPTSLVPGNRQTWAEHRMYLALAPGAVLVAWIFARWARARIALAFLAAALAVITFARNRDYRSALSLWSDTAAKRPFNAFAQYNLGEELLRQHQYPGARAALQKAIALKPEYAEAHNNLGNVLVQTGRMAAARAEFETAARLKPGDAEIRNNLGDVLMTAGDLSGAETQFRAAIADDPTFDTPRHGLAATLGRQGTRLMAAGETDAAVRSFAAAVQAAPGSASARFNYGNALAGQRQFREAIAQYEAALRLNPSDALIHYNYGTALLLVGRDDDARREYAAAVRLKPDFERARTRLRLLGGD